MTILDIRTRRSRLAFLAGVLCMVSLFVCPGVAQPAANQEQPRVVIDDDGTVHVPAQAVPMSAYLSPEAKAYVTSHLKAMQGTGGLSQGSLMKGFLDRQHILYPTDREETKIAGVHTFVYTPKAGISDRNKNRVLIDLHGGGFSGCWPMCAELESIPVVAVGRIKVVAVDYREAPDHKFPAASEDVASVYKELLKTYPAQNIGIYGCSAGGSLTAMSVAWFQKHDLPRPAAVGIFCASAGTPAGLGRGSGDGAYTAVPLGESRLGAAPTPSSGRRGGNAGYLDGTNPADPMVNPVNSADILSKFPPTLMITGTRGMELSAALYTHEQLVKLGVEADLHVWEGLFHGFFYDPDVPECKDAYNVMVKFFDKHLAH
jgi:epsilon-lactone hydrolase